MRVKSKGFVRTALAAAVAVSLFVPSVGYSLGVGKVQVRSALNQRLNAELELFSVKPDELSSLVVKISTQALAGNLSSQASNFDYSIETRRGRYFLKLVSKQPVREPLLNFLIELEWAQGRLLRELAIFLDPPASSVDPTLTAGLPPKTPAKTKPATRRTRPSQDTSPRASQPSSPPASQSSAEIVGNYGPVARGETLWGIADNMRPSGVSIPQMMQALYDANPRAFSRPGLDHLMAGVTLRVPTVGGARPAVAATEPQPTSAPTPVSEEQVEVRLVPPNEQEVATQTVNLPGSASTEQEGGAERLRIANLRDLQAQVQTAQSDEPEVLVAQSETAAEATVSDDSTPETPAESTVAETPLDSNALVAEESSTTEIAPAESSSESTANETVVQANPVEPQQSEQIGAPAESEPTGIETISVETAGAETTDTESPATESTNVETPQAAVQAEPTAIETQEQPQPAVATVETSREQSTSAGLDIVGLLIKLQNDPAGAWDDIQRHPLGLPIAGGVLIVLLLLIAMVARRSRKAEDYTEIERDLALSAAAARANEATQIVRRNTAEQQSETAARMRLQRVDFLMAGGSYQEAEKVLRRALSENPFDLNVKEKMLDVYYKSGNTDQFITVAESIRSQVDDEQSPLWQKIVKQGRRIYPGHPLFELTAEEDTIIFTPDTAAKQGANDDDTDRTVTTTSAEPERGVVLDFGTTRTAPEEEDTAAATRNALDDSPLEFDESEAPQLDMLNEWSDDTKAGDSNTMTFASVSGEEDQKLGQEDNEITLDESELQFDTDPEGFAADTELEFADDEEDVTMRFDLEQASSELDSSSDLDSMTVDSDADRMEFDLDTLSVDDETPQYPQEVAADFHDLAARPDTSNPLSLDDAEFDSEQPDEEDTRLISAALDGDATQVMETGDYVEIKLDLATAYLEMQDQAGAASLLEEVVNEGSAQQQSRAREMLAQLGR